MVVGTLELVLRLHGIHSLKEKRHAIRGLIEKCRREFGVSISEVDDHDLWGNSTIGVAYVHASNVQAEAVLQRVLELFESAPEMTVDQFALDFQRT